MKSIILIITLIQFSQLLAGTEEWIQKANLPASGRHGAIGFSVGNKGYVGMGHINSGAQGNQNFNDLWEYDTATNSWTQKADYPTAGFHYGTSFSYQNKGYIGFENEFYSFSPATNTYTELNTPPIALSYNTVVNTGHSILLIYYTNFYTYTPEDDSWSIIENDDYFYPQTAVTRGEKVYAIGYRNFYNWILAEWNTSTLRWDSISSYPDTLNRAHICSFELNGNFYFSMGATADTEVGKTNWKYDFFTKQWERLADFKGSGRRYYTTFEIENKAYICTGTNGTNFRNLWEFTPKDTLSQTVKKKPTLLSHPYPNPSQSTIFIDINENNDAQIYDLNLYNLQGQLVKTKQTSTHQFILNKESLQSGTYIYVIKLAEQTIKRGKIQFI